MRPKAPGIAAGTVRAQGFRRSELEPRGPRNDLTCPHQKASSGGFGVILRAESNGDDETGRPARLRRFSGG
eukprot:3871747-Alexandrium_andersonii.AAC.1